MNFDVRPGDRLGLVGPNGAGKTSLLRILAGDDTPDDGEIIAPKHVRIGMLRQEIDPTQNHSVREEASKALAHLSALETELRELEQEMARLGESNQDIPESIADHYHALTTRFEHAGGFEREARIDRVLAGLGFSEEERHEPLSSFSGGWLMRVELAKLLLSNPDVLLLDEPTNHLDLPSIEWLESLLADFRGAIVLISHDRTFLSKHVERVIELQFGELTLYEANFTRYLQQREERHQQRVAAKANQDKKIAEQEAFITRFRAKATKAKQVQSRIKALAKIERIEVNEPPSRALRLTLPEPTRCGDVPLDLTDIHKSYGDLQVYRGASLSIARGDRVALVGPNGAGKSTLLKIAAGILQPDQGECHLGHKVKIGHFAQHQLECLSEGNTVLEEIAEGAKLEDMSRLRGQLGAFLFSGDEVKKKVSVLSGGEKARLALAKMLLRPPNVLVLDEPTNHLDISACEVLEQALSQFKGTVLFISHDRAFINAVATRVVEIVRGELFEFPGNYDAYLAQLKKRDSANSNRPGKSRLAPSEAGETKDPAAGKAERMAARKADREEKKRREKAKRELGKLEGKVATLEEELEALGAQLADPAIWNDPEQARPIEAERSNKQESLDELYDQWEELSALCEDS
ncbi:MAG: ABC-F family ATP-binding cassette domain-containing protein [Deltaproteobacteria bacterium]|nr:ABC-F family ATP-binding cassette domain-containing protein [Deltaproteobacteria bacterium]